MSTVRLRRPIALVSTALLAVMLLGPSAVQAAPPGWAFENQAYLPATVSPGANAGYAFTIVNNGRSNISQLYLTSSATTSPSYVSSSRSGCSLAGSGLLFCSFGALNAGDSIDMVVAYTTPTSGASFSVTFQLNANGATFSDKGGNSRGDTLDETFTTFLNGSRNFAGGFTIDGSLVANDPKLGPKNIQAGVITPPTSNIPVTLEDGPNIAFSCTDCGTLFGEWTALNVANGAPFASGFKVMITVLGSKVPNGATVDTINLVHVDGDSSTILSQRCGSTTLPTVPGVECITVTKAGNNFLIEAWLTRNGGVRGAF